MHKLAQKLRFTNQEQRHIPSMGGECQDIRVLEHDVDKGEPGRSVSALTTLAQTQILSMDDSAGLPPHPGANAITRTHS